MASVGILMGSDSDWPVMEKAAEVLRSFGVSFAVEVTSAHRTPGRTLDIVRDWVGSGTRVFVVGAGGAAHLAGVVAAHVTVPVIAVPVSSSLAGIDALLSSVQMPPGVPVATVAVDGAHNAALLAVQILAVADPRLAEALVAARAALHDKVVAKSENLKRRLAESGAAR